MFFKGCVSVAWVVASSAYSMASTTLVYYSSLVESSYRMAAIAWSIVHGGESGTVASIMC